MTATEVGEIKEVLMKVASKADAIESRMDTFVTKEDAKNFATKDDLKKLPTRSEVQHDVKQAIKTSIDYTDLVGDKIIQRMEVMEVNIRADFQRSLNIMAGEMRVHHNHSIARVETLVMEVRDELKQDAATSPPLTQA